MAKNRIRLKVAKSRGGSTQLSRSIMNQAMRGIRELPPKKGSKPMPLPTPGSKPMPLPRPEYKPMPLRRPKAVVRDSDNTDDEYGVGMKKPPKTIGKVPKTVTRPGTIHKVPKKIVKKGKGISGYVLTPYSGPGASKNLPKTWNFKFGKQPIPKGESEDLGPGGKYLPLSAKGNKLAQAVFHLTTKHWDDVMDARGGREIKDPNLTDYKPKRKKKR